MQITEDISSYYYNAKNNTNADRYHWCILRKYIWAEQVINLYENPSRMPSGSTKANLQDIEKFIQI